MDVILDTCALLSLSGLVDRPLSITALEHIKQATLVGISACSSFEIAIKNKKGALPLDPFPSPADFWHTVLHRYDLTEIPINSNLFMMSVQLPDHHADPFDRLILATAIQEKIPIVTYDRVFSAYGVELID